MFQKKLDSILGSLQKTVKDLEAFVTQSDKREEAINQQISDLELENESLGYEVERAVRVKERIAELLQ